MSTTESETQLRAAMGSRLEQACLEIGGVRQMLTTLLPPVILEKFKRIDHQSWNELTSTAEETMRKDTHTWDTVATWYAGQPDTDARTMHLLFQIVALGGVMNAIRGGQELLTLGRGQS